MRRLQRDMVSLLVLPALLAPSALGSEKQMSYRQRFRAGVTWSSAAGQYRVRDFAFVMFNPNPTPLRLRATLTATQNPDYIYFARSDCVGDCSWDFILEGYKPCLTHAETLGSSGMFLLTALEPFWDEEFELEVKALGTSAASFYFYGPEDGFVTDSLGTDLVATQMAGWQEFRAEVPVFWDQELGGWVVPFATSYQNHPDWPLGWKTSIQIRNGEPEGEIFTIRNHNQASSLTFHGHDGPAPVTCCPEVAKPSGLCTTDHRFNTICQQARVTGSRTFLSDPYGFHIPGNAISQNDGQLFILPQGGTPANTEIVVRVEANPRAAVVGCPAESVSSQKPDQ